MSQRDRIRTGLAVALCAAALGVVGVIVYGLGPAALRVVGLVLIVFGMIGLAQAALIALGHMTPDAPQDRKQRDAGDD